MSDPRTASPRSRRTSRNRSPQADSEEAEAAAALAKAEAAAKKEAVEAAKPPLGERPSHSGVERRR